MPFKVIVGKPGGGKTYYAMTEIVKILLSTQRIIVTNLPLKLTALAEYMDRNYQGHAIDFARRVVMITGYIDRAKMPDETKAAKSSKYDESEVLDIPRAARFYLYRGWNLEGEIRDQDVPRIPGGRDRGVAYVIDEAHLFFRARDWKSNPRGLFWYMTQHRHFNDSVIWITQHPNFIDSNVRQLANHFVKASNLSMHAVWFMSLPSKIVYSVYSEEPRKGAKAEKISSITVGKDSLFDCYETLGGSGIDVGDIAVEQNEKPGWINWKTGVFGGMAAVLLCAYGCDKAVTGVIMNQDDPVKKMRARADSSTNGIPPDVAGQEDAAGGVLVPPAARMRLQPYAPAPSSSRVELRSQMPGATDRGRSQGVVSAAAATGPGEVFVTNYAFSPTSSNYVVYLSDGVKLKLRKSDVKFMSGMIMLQGKRYRIRPDADLKTFADVDRYENHSYYDRSPTPYFQNSKAGQYEWKVK